MIQKQSKKCFSTLAIFAGSPSADVQGAEIMRKMKEESKEEMKFIGLGGENMVKEGLEKNYGDLEKFIDKPFFPYKNFHRHYIEQPVHPLMAPLHYQEYQMRNTFKKNGFFRELTNTQPDGFLVLGNEFFMEKLFKNIAGEYNELNKVKPPCLMLDKLVINQENSMKDYLDHHLYTLPLQPVNWQSFTFPSTFIGKHNVYSALKWLLAKQEDYLWLSQEYHMEMVEQQVVIQRKAFRQQYNLEDEHTLIYLGCGNTKQEIQYSLPLALASLNELASRQVLNNQPTSNFRLVVSVQQHLQWVVDDLLLGNNNVLVVNNQQQKWQAMCAADFGMVITGDIANECAALHLPTICLNYQPSLQSYFTSLYGQWDADVNITFNGEIFPEKWTGRGGDAFPSNIADTWCQWAIDPRLRFQVLRRLQKVVPAMLPTQGQPVDQPNTNKAITRSTLRLSQCVEPSQLLVTTLHNTLQHYRLNLKDKQPHVPNVRNHMLQMLGHRTIQ